MSTLVVVLLLLLLQIQTIQMMMVQEVAVEVVGGTILGVVFQELQIFLGEQFPR